MEVKGSKAVSYAQGPAMKLEVWGNYALFTRPEFGAERVSYDVMTPSAARGIMDAVYWHPGIRWLIDKIYVMSPIRFINIRRTEVAQKLNSRQALKALQEGSVEGLYQAEEQRPLRRSRVLKNPHYVIEAHFCFNPEISSREKVIYIFSKRARNGRAFTQPYFGCREFAANFRLYEKESVPTIEDSGPLGRMLFDMDYATFMPLFFNAELQNGVLNVPQLKEYEA